MSCFEHDFFSTNRQTADWPKWYKNYAHNSIIFLFEFPALFFLVFPVHANQTLIQQVQVLQSTASIFF